MKNSNVIPGNEFYVLFYHRLCYVSYSKLSLDGVSLTSKFTFPHISGGWFSSFVILHVINLIIYLG